MVLSGFLSWGFFNSSIAQATRSLVANRHIILAHKFPLASPVVGTVFGRIADYVVILVFLLVLLTFFGHSVSLIMVLFLPLVLILQLVLQIGFGLMTAVLNAYYRDIQNFVDVLLQLLFYATPILYPLSAVPHPWRIFIQLHPMALAVEATRAILLSRRFPGSELLFLSGWATLALVVGVLVFKNSSGECRMSSDMTKPPAITITHISKSFDTQRTRSLKERKTWNKIGHEHVVKAVDDVSFVVPERSIVGLFGPNGSGKSTLLRLLAGIMTPDTGSIKTRGTVAAVLDLGAGLYEEATGWDNVFFVGSLMGSSKHKLRRVSPDVARFADIGRFMDAPIKTYSTGMRARLAFAIAIHATSADILLLDEILAVGDSDFQLKA